MQQTDSKRFRDLIRGMGRMYGQEPDGVVLDAYWLALRDWPLDDFEKACAHLMQTSEFMPRPAAFTKLKQAGRPTAGEAWLKALQHCESGAWRKGGSSGDPRVDAVAAMVGGYEAIALCETAKLGFIERRFAEQFETATDANDTRQAVPELTADDRYLERLANVRLVQ